MSFFGANGATETNEFTFENTIFTDIDEMNGIISNSTTTNAGLFP